MWVMCKDLNMFSIIITQQSFIGSFFTHLCYLSSSKLLQKTCLLQTILFYSHLEVRAPRPNFSDTIVWLIGTSRRSRTSSESLMMTSDWLQKKSLQVSIITPVKTWRSKLDSTNLKRENSILVSWIESK